ncbi:PTS transporter subunit EIIC [Spiroplasma diminutum]|uniref:PTS system N-acetylmuramic acid-specific EIIBC component n=1 Tax=Spiroplasma diminutum CUAS-1 TaxID=1276221 RepID=S5M078_9MOLU|nr:PTS transporter subunit EIIC [Spiroplasma diminutum]AGR42251.1 PTS system N-acetylmuramic acid-specific EIIBC component [Spiroplasma diminutum CUAS-1]
MLKQERIAKEILDIIKAENLISFTNCMTRLRITAKPNFDAEKLKTIDGVLGLVNPASDQFQIILGPGFVNKVATEFAKIAKIEASDLNENKINDVEFKTADEVGKDAKKQFRGDNKVSKFLSKISKVFTPLIPAFIGTGILSGIAGIIASSVNNNFEGHETLQSWNTILGVMLTILTSVFIIAVGWRMSEEWGANPGIGAIVAAMFAPIFGAVVAAVFVAVKVDGEGIVGYNFLGMFIKLENIEKNWFTIGFINYSINTQTAAKTAFLGAAHAGLIGAMMAVGVTIFIEKKFRTFMPGAIDTILTPVIVIFLMIFVNYFLLVPLAGYVFMGVAWFFEHLYINPFGAAFLAGIFLFAVAFGVHQGFLPVYFALIQETKVNGLFPILAMAGAAEVGSAIAMWIMAGKNSILRKQISGAIIPGILGIGEPLIYGISLPRVRPFIISCIAATVGGFYISALNTWFNLGIGMNAPTGPGGLTAAIMMTTVDGNVLQAVLIYLSALVLTYTSGILCTFFGYSKIARNGTDKMKSVYKKENSIKSKILYSFVFITLIGVIISWVVWWTKIDKDTKESISNYKLV